MSSTRRALVCHLAAPLPAPILSLMGDFRLMVNRGIREALEKDLTAKGSLSKFSEGVAREYRIHGAHARTAMDLALSLNKGHRRRLRKGVTGKVPYCLRSFLHADGATFHLNATTGHVRLSLRNGEWAGFDARMSDYHRRILASGKVKQLRLTPNRAILILEPSVPEAYAPKTVLALDTNERSLDGVALSRDKATPVTVPYPEVSLVQHRHFVRRRRLGRKKAHDRRVGRRLGGREGRREHARVSQRIHLISKGLVGEARKRRAAIVLEDLHLPRGGGRGRRMRRRLSSWPQRELHRQIEYKAEEHGVPIIKVNPRYTSKTCPRCGEVKERRSRVGRVFVCGRCRWRCDRQLNAGLNICRTALREWVTPTLNSSLGGLALDPDALAHDAMILLYRPGNAGSHEMSGRSGRNSIGPAGP
ncbi:MAG TPA: RNA-guided endonuclease TnpB family protein [Thermoplasmata archaeon]|nr:RNA-guided endonuclease TnpB family protein [Thermoplasmata archaeon]